MGRFRVGRLGLRLIGLFGLMLPALNSCAHGPAAAAQQMAYEASALASCQCLATGLASGKAIASQPSELWLSDERQVHKVGEDGHLTALWTAPRFSRIVRFETADLDGDGGDEWVVLLDSGRLRTAVVEHHDDTWALRGSVWNGIARPGPDEQGRTQLYGQRAGRIQPYSGPVFQLTPTSDGGLEEAPARHLPDDLSVLDWAVLTEGSSQHWIGLEDTGHLSVRDPRSPRAMLWRSDERPVARPQEWRREVRDLLGSEEEQIIRFAPPVQQMLGETPEGQSVPGLLIVSGPPGPAVVFERLRVLAGGDLRLYVRSTRGLVESHRTPLLGRAMVAGTVWERPVGAPVWAGVVWTDAGQGFRKPNSRVFLFDSATGDLIEPPAAVAEPPDGSQAP